MVEPLWRTVWRFLRKLKMELSYEPAIPLLGIYLEKAIIQKGVKKTVSLLSWSPGSNGEKRLKKKARTTRH